VTGREIALEAIERGAMQKLSELEPLVALVRERRPQTVVEIGTSEGGSLYAWCRAADPNGLIVSIDKPGGLFGGGYSEQEARAFQEFAGPGQRLYTLRRNSQSRRTRRKLRSLLGDREIDFLMIDGDHTYKGVKRDWKRYEPLVAPEGLIAFHDILEHPKQPLCKVDELWREITPHHETVEFTDPEDDRGHGQWGGIGVVFKDAAGERPEAVATQASGESRRSSQPR
jgi:predicted O-methyltransferase YrrM